MDLPCGYKWESLWITDSRASVCPRSIGLEWHFPSLTHYKGTHDIALKCPQVPVPLHLYVKDVGFGAKSQCQCFFKHPYQGKQHRGDVCWVQTRTWDCVQRATTEGRWQCCSMGLSDISNSLGLSLEGFSVGKRRRTWCIIIVKRKKEFEDYEVPEHTQTPRRKKKAANRTSEKILSIKVRIYNLNGSLLLSCSVPLMSRHAKNQVCS